MSQVREAATQAVTASRVRIRVLHGVSDLEDARQVCDAVWPSLSEGTQVTSNLLTAIEHAGGYVSAAYDLDGDPTVPVAGTVSIVGRHRSANGTWESHLHSHMTAVLDGVRDRGIGTAMKFDQRAWAHEQGIPLIGWTFDPLVRRNAWLNLVKLGATAAEYLPNFYGSMDDELNANDESDRLYVWWRTDSMSSGAVVEAESDDVVVPIPEDIIAVRAVDASAAAQWRADVRAAMNERMKHGWVVRGVNAEGSYVLSKGH